MSDWTLWIHCALAQAHSGTSRQPSSPDAFEPAELLRRALEALEDLIPAEARAKLEDLAEQAEQAGAHSAARALRAALEVLARRGPVAAVSPIGYALAGLEWG